MGASRCNDSDMVSNDLLDIQVACESPVKISSRVGKKIAYR